MGFGLPPREMGPDLDCSAGEEVRAIRMSIAPSSDVTAGDVIFHLDLFLLDENDFS